MAVVEIPKKETPEHLKGLPDDLIDQLSTRYKKKGNTAIGLQEFFEEIQSFFENQKNSLSLDELLIMYFQKTGKIMNRNNMHSKLQKFVKEGYLIRPSRETYQKAIIQNGISSSNPPPGGGV